jgi:hypothetical protein
MATLPKWSAPYSSGPRAIGDITRSMVGWKELTIAPIAEPKMHPQARVPTRKHRAAIQSGKGESAGRTAALTPGGGMIGHLWVGR